MSARISTISIATKQIDYSDLVELMYIKHHTRESVGMAIGKTGAAFGRYLKKGLPMTGENILRVCELLEIDAGDIGRFFFNGKSKASDGINLDTGDLVMMRLLTKIAIGELPTSMRDEAIEFRSKIDKQIEGLSFARHEK